MARQIEDLSKALTDFQTDMEEKDQIIQEQERYISKLEQKNTETQQSQLHPQVIQQERKNVSFELRASIQRLQHEITKVKNLSLAKKGLLNNKQEHVPVRLDQGDLCNEEIFLREIQFRNGELRDQIATVAEISAILLSQPAVQESNQSSHTSLQNMRQQSEHLLQTGDINSLYDIIQGQLVKIDDLLTENGNLNRKIHSLQGKKEQDYQVKDLQRTIEKQN